MDVFRGGTGDGGVARAFGEAGEDATSSTAAKKGGSVTAIGGDAGSTNGPDIAGIGEHGFTLRIIDPKGGSGGGALGLGENGGEGNKDFPTGGAGPDMSVVGGKGAFINLFPSAEPDAGGIAGDGGAAQFVGGDGGLGWDACNAGFLFERGGDGGSGGTLTGNNGERGRNASSEFGQTLGQHGVLLVQATGNGGDGKDGAPAKSNGGAAGTNGVTPVDGTTATITNSFEKGTDGELCKHNFNVGITVKSGGDPNGHEEFITLTTVTMIMAQITAPGVIEFTSDRVIWVKTTGAVGADGSFTTTGNGRVAGTTGVPVTFDGTVVLDGDGKITGINGMLVYDSTNSHLPPQEPQPAGDGLRHPANYNLSGTLQPPA